MKTIFNFKSSARQASNGPHRDASNLPRALLLIPIVKGAFIAARSTRILGAVLAAWGAMSIARADAEPADEVVRAHVTRERNAGDAAPLLSLDPVVASRLEGIAKEQRHEATTITYAKTSLVLESIEAANIDREDKVALDVPLRAWRVGARLSRKLGPLELEATASLGSLQSRYTEGDYYDIGAALTYRRKLSHWMTAWISLRVGRRTWLGDKPPDGEVKQSEQVMLSVGTTFK